MNKSSHGHSGEMSFIDFDIATNERTLVIKSYLQLFQFCHSVCELQYSELAVGD